MHAGLDEQAEAKAKAIGPATDVYALGAILYELLTGRPPFRAETPLETLHQVQAAEPVSPSRLQPRLPHDLETITLKCLAKEPGKRYPSAGALAEDLERWLEGRPIRARRIGVLGRTGRWCRRNPKLAGAVAAASVFLLVGTLVSSLLAVHAQDEAKRADGEAARALAAKRLSDRRYYASEMKLASLELEAGQLGSVQDRLRELERQGAAPPELRGFEWHYLQRLCQLQPRLLQGHKGLVTGVAFSPDGCQIASAGEDGTVRLWDAATGRETRKLPGPEGLIWGVAFSPDGRLASAHQDGTVRLWDAGTCQTILRLRGHTGPVYGVAFSPDGKQLASAGEDETVRVWDPATGEQTFCLKQHTGPVRGVAFSPDGKYLASASEDRTVQLWEAATGQHVRALDGHTATVWGVAFSADSKHLASASEDSSTRVWDAATGQTVHKLEGHMGKVFGVAFSPDGHSLDTANQNNTVLMWDAATGQELYAPPIKAHTGTFWGVAFSPDGRRLAGACHDGTVRLSDAALRPQTLTLEGHPIDIVGVAFSPDGRWLASVSLDRTVKLWDADTGLEIRTLPGHADTVMGVAFSPPDGSRVASASIDGTVRVWETATGKELLVFNKHTGWVLGVVFSPDGRRIASASHDGTVRVWEADTGREIYKLDGPTGQRLVMLTRFRSTFRLATPAFSPDGSRLGCASGENLVKVWDAATGKELVTCKGHMGRVFAVAFSPDGKRLASGSDDQSVKVWDTATGTEILSMRHPGWATGVAYCPDGRRLASTATDGTMRIWDAATGQEIIAIHADKRGLSGLAFSPDGGRLTSGGRDGSMRVWDATELTPQGLIAYEARGLVQWLFAKGLSPDEVVAAVRRDPTITEPVRQQALAWVEPGWRIQVRAEARPLLGPLFAKGLLRAEVLASLRANSALRPAVREDTLVLAETYPENAAALHQESRAVVRQPGASAATYERALRQAEAAYQLTQKHFIAKRFGFLNTKGIAYYRVAKYQEALEALTVCNDYYKGSDADVLSFLAMTQHQFGQKREAQETLARLRQVMQQPRWARSAEAQGFLREAEELLKSSPATGKK